MITTLLELAGVVLIALAIATALAPFSAVAALAVPGLLFIGTSWLIERRNAAREAVDA